MFMNAWRIRAASSAHKPGLRFPRVFPSGGGQFSRFEQRLKWHKTKRNSRLGPPCLALNTRLPLAPRLILANQWALRSTHTAAELKEIFRGFIGPNDRIVVTEVGAEWASRKAMTNIADL
jgi:hypothetical protein